MPTLFRLVMLLAIIVGCCWGVALAMVTFLTPSQREIEQVVFLPANVDLTTGRSAAERLTREVALLGRGKKHH